MRILIYGINFAPELTGIGKYSGEMAAYLAEHGHAVRMITAPPYYPEWRIKPGYTGMGYRKETWQRVTVYRCPLWVPKRTRSHPQLTGFQRILHLTSFAISSFPVVMGQVKWKPDRVIAVAPSIFTAPTAAFVASLARGKSWLHIQDFEVDAAARLNMLPGLRMLLGITRAVEKGLYNSFDRVSTISNRMLAHLWEKGISPADTVLFPNWVDLQQIYPIHGYNGLRRKLSIDETCKIVLYSGNIGQKQGLEVLVEAAHQLIHEGSLVFLICGEGAVKAQLEEMARDLPNVRFLPLQPPEQLNELLNLASMHILPQAAGAADLVMPSKLSGMLASGRPVIVTANPGTELAEIMSSLGRVIPPGDPARLASAISELAQQPEVGDELGHRGRAFVETHWAKDVVLDNFIESLSSI